MLVAFSFWRRPALPAGGKAVLDNQDKTGPRDPAQR